MLDWLTRATSAIAVFNELPLKKIALIILFLISMVCAYESYTMSFRLAREDKSIHLLKDLQQLEQNEILKSERLKKPYFEVVERIDLLFTKAKKSRQVSWWEKGIVSSWPWLVLIGCSLGLRSEGFRTVLITSTVFAAAAFYIGTQSPLVWWPWFHAIILVMIQGVFCYIVWMFVTSLNRSKK